MIFELLFIEKPEEWRKFFKLLTLANGLLKTSDFVLKIEGNHPNKRKKTLLNEKFSPSCTVLSSGGFDVRLHALLSDCK